MKRFAQQNLLRTRGSTTTQLDEVSKKYNTCMSFFKKTPKDETIYSEDEL